MQDFLFDRVRLQEAEPEPYTVYRPEQAVQEEQKENKTLRDFEYFRSMYPARVKKLQHFVEEECDKLDYQGSPMYDEFPDRLMVEQLRRRIEVQAQEQLQSEEMAAEEIQTREEASKMEAWMREAQVQPKPESPRTSQGPDCTVQSALPESGNYKTWELTETPLAAEEEEENLEDVEKAQEIAGERRPGGPWGPPPPPPGRPWGPPPPPPGGPWGPPPPPPGGPWGPPPPPPGRPWGPPPPPRPGKRFDLGDIISLLLFGEMQRRRCGNGICR